MSTPNDNRSHGYKQLDILRTLGEKSILTIYTYIVCKFHLTKYVTHTYTDNSSFIYKFIFNHMKNKKKLWLSVVIITAVAAAAIGGSYAFFTAQRTAAQNKFASGTLDLSVTGNNNVVNEPFVVENLGENANISGTKTWTIKNTGTLPGRLLVRLNNVVNEENGCNDQEKGTEPNCDQDNEGELGGVITANVALDGVDKVSSTLATSQQSKIGDDWNALEPIIIPANGEKTVTIHWATSETGYGNEVQSDSIKFDSVFRLIQLINGPTPINR